MCNNYTATGRELEKLCIKWQRRRMPFHCITKRKRAKDRSPRLHFPPFDSLQLIWIIWISRIEPNSAHTSLPLGIHKYGASEMYLVRVERAEVPMPEWIWFAICVSLAKHKYAKEINVIQSQKVLNESRPARARQLY